jgi:hypothetical protein
MSAQRRVDKGLLQLQSYYLKGEKRRKITVFIK